MLAITLADLRFRLRQFLIAVVGAGVTFAMALLLTGMVTGFYNEVTRTVASAKAESWIVADGTSGPFTAVQSFPEPMVEALRKTPGVESAHGLLIGLQSVDRGERDFKRVMMIGATIGSPSVPTPTQGRAPAAAHEAIADARLQVPVGGTFDLAGREFTVVGTVEGLTMLGGTPDVWIPLRSAQQAMFGGQRLLTAVALSGTPANLPPGLDELNGADVETDSMGVMQDAVMSVDNSRYLMWVVAAIIIAALVYVSALQRTRDFAVLKAVGASSRLLFASVAAQAVIVSLAAALFAVSTSWLFRPLYRVPVEVPTSAYVALPLVAVAVGILSSLTALTRAVKVDPALAFGAA